MNPGRMREKITIQGSSDDPAGQYRSPERADEPWTDEFTDKASVSTDRMRSDIVGGAEEPKRRATFRVRTRSEYRAADITQKRIIWKGEAYEIESVDPVDRQRRFLDISTVYSGVTV